MNSRRSVIHWGYSAPEIPTHTRRLWATILGAMIAVLTVAFIAWGMIRAELMARDIAPPAEGEVELPAALPEGHLPPGE